MKITAIIAIAAISATSSVVAETQTSAPRTTTPAPYGTTPAPRTTAPTPGTTTPAPATTTPAPYTGYPTPGPSTPAPGTTTPAPSSAYPSPTPAITVPTMYPTVVPTPAVSTPAGSPSSGCTQVSVVGDATYCIQGPVCSGSGLMPAGSLCPKAGDVAIQDCLKSLKSYVEAGKCVAPVDAVCQKIPSGAWGCLWG